MNLQPVKSAEGRRVRHPETLAVLPGVADADAEPITVDLDHPHWHRALESGDIVVIKAAPARNTASSTTTASTAADSATAAASSKAS